MYFHLSTASGLTQPCVMCEDTEFTRECPWLLFLLSVAQITNLLQIPVKEWTSLVLKSKSCKALSWDDHLGVSSLTACSAEDCLQSQPDLLRTLSTCAFKITLLTSRACAYCLFCCHYALLQRFCPTFLFDFPLGSSRLQGTLGLLQAKRIPLLQQY